MSSNGGLPGFDPRLSGDQRRRRAGFILGGVALAVILVIALVIAVMSGRGGSPGEQAQPTPGPAPTAEPAPEPGWDVAAQTELANRAMPAFPESAAFPHTLSSRTAGPPFTLPKPGPANGQLVPGGFPQTPEGAIAQLAELTRIGLQGGDPDAYAATYASVAEPGAPAAQTTFLFRDLQAVRARASMPARGAVAGLTFSWEPTSALIKGSTDEGRYVVACVLGELTTGRNGQLITAGTADCQALRWVGDNWRISPGALAARAPVVWPGSAEAVQAGYRDLR